MSERLPPPDPARFPDLAAQHVRTLPAGTACGRIHRTGGSHARPWNDFRAFGPVPGARFDHHLPPAGLSPDRGILYVVPRVSGTRGTSEPVLKTALAETYRDEAMLDVHREDPHIVVFRTRRDVRLLDLSDTDWVTRAGGNGAISAGVRQTARAWSRAIYAHYGVDLDGLVYASSNLPSARLVALYERARDAVPPRPEAHVALSEPALMPELERYCSELGIGLLL